MKVWTRFAAKTEPAKPMRLVLLGTLALAAFSAACSAPGEDAPGVALEAATTFANDKTAYDYFRGKGLTNFQAAAVVGNLDQESGVNPTISQNGGGVGRGIAQWSTGARWDTTKGDNVMAFAAMEGQSATSLGLQLDFMWFELTMFPDYGLAELKASTTLNDATQVVEDKYEGCVYANFPECALPQRQKYAATVFAAYMNDPVMGGGGAGAGGASSTGGASGASQGGSSAGGSSAGGSSGASSAGSAGAPSAAGEPSTGGDLNTGAGAANVAGAPSGTSTAGATSVAGGASGAASFGQPGTKNDSGCAVARPGATRPGAVSSASSIGLWSALVAFGLTLRVSRRRRRES
jgi:hypothetical protein